MACYTMETLRACIRQTLDLESLRFSYATFSVLLLLLLLLLMWPAPNVWVFIAQWEEHRNANAEAIIYDGFESC